MVAPPYKLIVYDCPSQNVRENQDFLRLSARENGGVSYLTKLGIVQDHEFFRSVCVRVSESDLLRSQLIERSQKYQGLMSWQLSVLD